MRQLAPARLQRRHECRSPSMRFDESLGVVRSALFGSSTREETGRFVVRARQSRLTRD